jgi:hypothetical protein
MRHVQGKGIGESIRPRRLKGPLARCNPVLEPASNRIYARALVKPLGAVPVRFVSIPTLIEMKTAVGRVQDMIDIEHLKTRLEDHGGK